ncbi:hypothetical protein ED733_007710 [Metarhizium rileyi]|uniref:Uncharacterized protein n=1 Tax=Metarhizium rileyi (strain RCEF 4871) TaxID=1649241 RepID=A0A5C6GLD4_METRR|nr:hypothetical protein ED733_007710 [Metarhizium rileyi]
MSPGFFWVIRDFGRRFIQLFRNRRLYNAVISTSTVNLAQQLCGGEIEDLKKWKLDDGEGDIPYFLDSKSKLGGQLAPPITAMAYSLGFGAINFVFALPAVKSNDTLGRRRWLLLTIPFMAVFMLGAGLSDYIERYIIRNGVTACFLFREYPIICP